MTSLLPSTPFSLGAITASSNIDLNWTGTFEEYCQKVIEHPDTVQTAHQRLYAAIAHHGSEEYSRYREKIVRWKVFDDPFTNDHINAVYGNNVDPSLMKLVSTIRAAALCLGQERRMILLRGPVGTAKSTIADLFSSSLEHFTRLPQGQLFAPIWVVEPNDKEGQYILGTITQTYGANERECPLHEEPLAVLPTEIRIPLIRDLEQRINKGLPKNASPRRLTVNTSPCPLCALIFNLLLTRYNGDWHKVIEKHLRVRRIVLSEAERKGIVIVRPKHEKDQDVAEFLGDHNLNTLGAYGSTTDPRTFNFDGHYMSSNRGMFYWEEQLKFSISFLYDLLGASMEHKVQPRAFRQVYIDEVLIGSTNNHEHAKLKENAGMEALRDRTISIQVPYILQVSDEIRVHEKFFTPDRRGGKHLAPHTLYIASLWAVLTRLVDAKKAGSEVDRLAKARLYDGQQVRGFTDDAVKELIQEGGDREGTGEAISPRYIGDKISAAFMSADNKGCVNPFIVLRELKNGLKEHEHIKDGKKREEYAGFIELAQQELVNLLKEDLQAAIVGDEEHIRELYDKYADNVAAWSTKTKVKDPVTKEDVSADVDFMHRVEDMIEISDHEGFRQKFMNAFAKRAKDAARDKSVEPYSYKTDQELYNALRLYLFEQTKDNINWEVLISRKATDSGQQRRIDEIRDRLITNLGYCDICAPEVMTHVAGIFKRGERAKTGA